jgi:poly(A)-specific ribonuclease
VLRRRPVLPTPFSSTHVHPSIHSFDCEFTGLNVGPNTTHDLLDTPEERFQKVHQCVRAFTVLQVGVAIFAFDPATRRWTCRPFNFWTIPDAKVGKGVFASQASSLQFLVECGFDLNKCVGKGIPFVPASERSKTEQRRAQLAQRPPIIPSSDRDIAFVRDLLIKVTDWLTRSDNDEEDSADGGWNDDLCLDPTNGFLRALTYQILERDPVRFGGNNDRADPGFR